MYVRSLLVELAHSGALHQSSETTKNCNRKRGVAVTPTAEVNDKWRARFAIVESLVHIDMHFI